MLDSYRKAHEEIANAYIPEWKSMNKNDLVNKYIEVENDPVLADAYMSAIICRYWGNIYKYDKLSHNSIRCSGTGKEIYYDWLVTAIYRAIRDRKWKDPTNKLYNDPYGPDKVINRCILSERLIWFQSSNMLKRRPGFQLESVEGIVESAGSELLPSYCDEETEEGYLNIQDLVYKSFKSGNHFMAFTVDTISRYDVFVREGGSGGCLKFSKRKALKHIRYPEVGYEKQFAQAFHLPYDEVEKAVEECKNYSQGAARAALEKSIKALQRVYIICEREEA